jgi:hypothetical protein
VTSPYEILNALNNKATAGSIFCDLEKAFDSVNHDILLFKLLYYGSILGPLLFLVYTNDLPKAVECKALPILFADDTSILLTSPNNIQMHSDHNKENR